MNTILPSKEELNELFFYQNGYLVRKKITARRHKLGEVVGGLDDKGYMQTTIKCKPVYVHRIIYKMFYGKDPKYIDHIDGNPRNNKIENLQEITPSENRLKSNVSKNVYYRHGNKDFLAQVQINGKRLTKSFKDKKSATKYILKLKESFLECQY